MTNILLSLAKNTKHEHFVKILMTITLGVTWQLGKMTPLFSFTLQALSIDISNFSFQDLQNSVSLLQFVLFCKIHIYMPKMTLLMLLTWISFLNIKFATKNFSYILFPIWYQFGPDPMDYTCHKENQVNIKYIYNTSNS